MGYSDTTWGKAHTEWSRVTNHSGVQQHYFLCLDSPRTFNRLSGDPLRLRRQGRGRLFSASFRTERPPVPSKCDHGMGPEPANVPVGPLSEQRLSVHSDIGGQHTGCISEGSRIDEAL